MNIEESMGYLLNTSAKLVKRDFDRTLKNYNLTTSQWAILVLLSNENNLTQVQISQRLNSDKATSGAIIEKLIQKNLLTKIPLAKDKRAYTVSILDPAIRLVSELTSSANKSNKKIVHGLTDLEIKNLKCYLRKIICSYEEEL